MTRITIDPGELLATAETLRGCAAESAAVGSSLASCAQCAMPPDIQHVVDQVAVTADRLLAEIGARIGTHATDLVNRAQIAANDSLVGANQASAPAGWGGSSAQDLLGGTSTIGGNVAPAFTIAGTSVTSVQELLGGTSTIGGNVVPAFTGGPPPEAFAMTATLGGVDSTSGDTRSLMEAIQGPTAVGGYATYDIAGGGALDATAGGSPPANAEPGGGGAARSEQLPGPKGVRPRTTEPCCRCQQPHPGAVGVRPGGLVGLLADGQPDRSDESAHIG